MLILVFEVVVVVVVHVFSRCYGQAQSIYMAYNVVAYFMHLFI